MMFCRRFRWASAAAVGALLLAVSPAAAQQYDLLLKGGHVFDAKNQRDGVMDVAITNKKIAAVEKDIPVSSAKTTLDVSGLYVTPGLVDLHVHVYAGTGVKDSYAGDNSIYPDGYAVPSGITTVVDAGCAGWKNFPDFKSRIIDRSMTRVLAMLNVVGSGMGPGQTEQNTDDMDADETAKMALKYPGLIVGVKSAHYRPPDWISVDTAVAAGKKANIPVMVDFGRSSPERSFDDLVLKHLRPGDIVTHMYVRRYLLLNDDGSLSPLATKARERGIKFDVGHGNTSFSWEKVVPAVRQGFLPDSISSDAHVRSTLRSMKDLPTVISKMLATGVSLRDAIEMSTVAPALLVNRPDLGHLTVGSEADVAVFSIRKGDFGFFDGRGVGYQGHQKLDCELTVRAGEVIWDLNGLTSTPYQDSKP